MQVSESARSSSYPNEEGYCVCGVHRRRQLDGRERRTSQLQDRRREQDQGMHIPVFDDVTLTRSMFSRSLSQGKHNAGESHHTQFECLRVTVTFELA
jgi:hypothetical protein